ncbi:co-chaperone GroES [bacterium]|nr:co-chaperone GroES [bacterium]
MKIRPIGDRIVIKVIEDTAQTEGGIFIPDSAKEKPQKGEVVAVGEGKTLDSGEKAPVSVKVGETVIYEKYAGRDIKIDGVLLKILSTSDVLGVLEA